MTLEEGRIRTCRFPDFSALLMALSASLRTEVLTILSDGDSQIVEVEMRYLHQLCVSLHGPLSMESALMSDKRVLQLVIEEVRSVDILQALGAWKHSKGIGSSEYPLPPLGTG